MAIKGLHIEATRNFFNDEKIPYNDAEDLAPLVITATSLRVSETIEKKPLLPPDLVDSESDDERPQASPASSLESMAHDKREGVEKEEAEEEEEEGYEEGVVENNQDDEGDEFDGIEDQKKKVGRWTLSKGAARKPSTSKTRIVREEYISDHPTSPRETDKLQIHSESQRLIREADIHLPEHRPKQFKRFSEFKESLRAGPSVSTQVACEAESPEPVVSTVPINMEHDDITEDASSSHVEDTVTSTSAELPNQSALDTPTQSDASASCTCPPSCSSNPSTFSFQVPEPVSLTRKSKATKLLSLLPTALPPVHRLSEDDEGFVDLGESILPEKPFVLTPADRLLARFKQHTRTPPIRKERVPIEYTVLTKVVDEVSGDAHLRVESITHKSSSQPSESELLLQSSDSHRRKFWKQHRETLKEQMRQRRLEQYEARLKEQGLTEGQTRGVINNDKGLSDDDAEWSEGQEEPDDEEEASTEESESSSSDSSSTEGEADTEDEDDVPASSRRGKRACAFADDEAEESGDDGGSGTEANDSDLEDVVDHTASTSEQVNPGRDSRCTPDRQLGCAGFAPRPRNDSCSKFDKLMDLDDFTDLPSQLTDLSTNRSAVGKYCPDTTRRPQGSLGPGDVDLFMTEYSTILDRTANAPSILASTRLDVTAFDDHAKYLGTHPSRETSVHTQWNDTPYELLYSQKPISQGSSFSKEPPSEMTDTPPSIETTPRLSSQDTVLLSQPSIQDAEVDTTVKLPVSDFESTQDSQEMNDKRRQLFPVFHRANDCENVQLNDLEDTVRVDPSLMTQDSQVVHANRHQLFGSSVSESPSLSIQGDQTSVTQDSQAAHDNRCNLFGSSVHSISEHPSGSVQQVEELIASQDSQQVHMNRRCLFASSDQSNAEPLNFSVPDSDVVIVQELPEPTQNESFVGVNCPSQSLFSEPSISRDDPGSLDNALLDSTSSDPSVQLPQADSQASQHEHDRRRALFSNFDVVDGVSQNDVPAQKGEHPNSCEVAIPVCNQSSLVDKSFDNCVLIDDHSLKKVVEEPEDVETMELKDIETKTKPRRRVVVIDEDEESNEMLDKFNPLIVGSKLDREQTADGSSPIKPFDLKSDEIKASIVTKSVSDDDSPVTDPKEELEEEEDENEDEDVSSMGDEKSDNESFMDEDENRKALSGESETEEASDEEVALALSLKQDKVISDQQKKRKKRFRVDDFLDEEAELSGDEDERAFYMDDDEEDGEFDDDLEELAVADDDPDLPSAGRLRRQVERVHNRLQADQDQRELRFLKELYLEDGDLYAENGKARQRRFRWRGLENDDPLADAASFSVDDADDDSEEDDAAAAVSRFGPMDRWLQHTGVLETRKPDAQGSEALTVGVDLDSSINLNDASLVTSDDEEKENEDETSSHVAQNETGTVADAEQTNTLSVLSLGRKAVLKARTLETQITIKTVNKKVSARKPAAVSPKLSATSKSTTTLTSYFTSQNITVAGESGQSIFSTQQTNTVDQVTSFIAPSALSVDGRTKMAKCGSLLARRFSASSLPKPGAMGRVSTMTDSDLDSEVCLISDDSESSSGLPGGSRKNQVNFLGLRNKVGMSCFNVVSQPEASSHAETGSLAPSNPFVRSTVGRLSQNSSTRSFDLGKRPASGPAPPNMKRQRSASVFSALL